MKVLRVGVAATGAVTVIANNFVTSDGKVDISEIKGRLKSVDNYADYFNHYGGVTNNDDMQTTTGGEAG